MSFVGFFGPRSMDAQGLKLLDTYFVNLTEEEVESMTVVTGGAQGFDFAAAWLARKNDLPVTLILPTRNYVDWFYFGKGHNQKFLGSAANMETLLVDPSVNIKFVAPAFTKGSNFLRNTRLAELVDHSVTLSDAPTTVGTKHCLSEHFRLGKPVEFLAQ